MIVNRLMEEEKAERNRLVNDLTGKTVVWFHGHPETPELGDKA